MLLGTGSSLYRSMLCPLSEQLPHVVELNERRDDAAERGTSWHTYAEHLGTPHALEMVPAKYHKELKALKVDALAGYYTTEGQRELKFKYDLRTGTAEALPFKGHRQYGTLEEYEVTCTMDVVVAGYLCLEVWDYKTGGDKRSFLPVESNPQLLFGALCAQKALAPHARWILVGVQHAPPRKQKFVEVPQSYCEMVDLADLWTFEDQLKRAYQRGLEVKKALAKGTQLYNPGEKQCRWCPAKKACEGVNG